MTTTTPDPYPEHTRQRAILDQAQAIGEFIESNTYVLAQYVELDGWTEPQLLPVSRPIKQILADYFGIDLAKIDAEQRAILADLAALP